MRTRTQHSSGPSLRPVWIRFGWAFALLVAIAVRLWNGFNGPMLRGYDDLGHIGYVLYLDLYHAIPWADQGWSYFHPPLHYVLGWGLAQFRDVAFLVHGLALFAGAASLGIAYLASRMVRLANPARSDLPLFAFFSVGLLPVYLYSSTMAGNEVTAALLGTLGLCVLVANECRAHPLLRRDALAGAILGFALLTKVSAVLVLGACGLTLLFRLLREPIMAAAAPRVLLRATLLAGCALVIACPYYARNVMEFGTPFKMSRENPHVAKIESAQPPGSRTWVDFVAFPPELFLDPNPRAEHLLHSVWGTAYAGMWADTRKSAQGDSGKNGLARSAMVILGLAPTLLAVIGAMAAFRDIVRRRRRAIYTPMFCMSILSLAAFVYFAISAPQFSALKASYLLGLTLPYAVFLARGLEGLGRLGPWRGIVLAAFVVGIPGIAAALVGAHGLLLQSVPDHNATASLHVYFEERAEAERLYREQIQSPLLAPSVHYNLASLSMLDGDPFRARQQFALLAQETPRDPLAWNALGVATALAGELQAALDPLNRAVAEGAGEVAYVNRGVVRTSLRQFVEAESDFREALAVDESLVPAWHGLAELLARSGRDHASTEARIRAQAAASRAPRGHPYGIPSGLGQHPTWALGFRWMLWPTGEALRLAAAPFREEDAIATGDESTLFSDAPHIVLITIDTLRADHLGAYGYERPTSPTIDGLARRGVLFKNAFAASSWTMPSVASLFTSRTPAEHQAVSWGRPLRKQDTTFVERLKLGGYKTVGVSGNFVHVNEKVGFNRGFDQWETLSVPVEDPEQEALIHKRGAVALRAPTAHAINEVALKYLGAPAARPSFLYLHYMEPHSEYNPPVGKRDAFVRDPEALRKRETITTAYLGDLVRGGAIVSKAERQHVIDLYDAEIASVDAAIGELIEALTSRGFGDKLLVAVVSDHGEEFGDHSSWFHGLTLHRESLGVPFVVWDSRKNQGRVIENPVDLLDVPTTLLAAAGIAPSRAMRGRNVLPFGPKTSRELTAALAKDRLFEQRLGPRNHRLAVTRWPWKVIVDRTGTAQIFQLERDPKELAPLAPDDAGVPQQIAKRARAMLANDPERANARGRLRNEPGRTGRAPTPAEREQLRALGYAE